MERLRSQDNFTELQRRAGNAMGIMTHLVAICGGSFVTEEKVRRHRPSRPDIVAPRPRSLSPNGVSLPFLQATEVEKFFQEHPVPLASRKINQMLENTRINAKWLETMKQGKLGDDGFFVLIMMTMDMA